MEIHLLEILKQLGTNASSFAKQIGVARNSLPINNTFAPTIDKLQSYAERLGIPVWTLIYKECVTVKPGAYTHPESAQQTLARRVKELLEEQQISKMKAAERAGMSPSSFHLAITRNVSTTVLEKIARGLGVEPWELFTTNEEVDEYLHGASSNAAPSPAAVGAVTEPEASAKAGRYVAVPLLPNGSPDLSKLEWIDTPEGRVLVWPMSEVRIIDVPSEGVEDAAEDEDTLLLTEDR